MKTKLPLFALLSGFLVSAAVGVTPDDGSVLPFPPTPMKDSVAKPRLQDSKMKWPADLGSTVSLDYFDRRPFEFNGKIDKVSVHLN